MSQASKAADDEVVQPSDLASGGSRYNPAELMYQVCMRGGTSCMDGCQRAFAANPSCYTVQYVQLKAAWIPAAIMELRSRHTHVSRMS